MGFEKIEVQNVNEALSIVVVKPDRKLQVSHANREFFFTLITHALKDSSELWIKTNKSTDKAFLNEFVSTKTFDKLKQQKGLYAGDLSYHGSNHRHYVSGNQNTCLYIQTKKALKFLEVKSTTNNPFIPLQLIEEDAQSINTACLFSGLVTIKEEPLGEDFYLAELCDDSETKTVLLPKKAEHHNLFYGDLPAGKAFYVEFNDDAITKIASTAHDDASSGKLCGKFLVVKDVTQSESPLWLVIHLATGIRVNLGKTAFYRLPYHFESGDYFKGDIQFSQNKWGVTRLNDKPIDAYNDNEKTEDIELQYIAESNFYNHNFFIFLDPKTQNKYRLNKSQFTGYGCHSPLLYIAKIQENTKFIITVKCENPVQDNDKESHLCWYLTQEPKSINSIPLGIPFVSEVICDAQTKKADWLGESSLTFGLSALRVSVKLFPSTFWPLGIYRFSKLAKVEFDLSATNKKLDWRVKTIEDICKFEFGNEHRPLTLLHHISMPHEHQNFFDTKLFYKDSVVTCFDFSADITLLVYLSNVMFKKIHGTKKLGESDIITAVIKNLYHPSIARQAFVATDLKIESDKPTEQLKGSKEAQGKLQLELDPKTKKFKIYFIGTLEGEKFEEGKLSISDELLNLTPEVNPTSQHESDMILIQQRFHGETVYIKFDQSKKITEITSIGTVSNNNEQ